MISKNNITKFEKDIGYTFKNKNFLISSLMHPSFYTEKKIKAQDMTINFERLEFLGDRVLGLAISSNIFKKFPKNNEGDLSKKLSYLVQKNFLYKIAINLKIDKILKFSSKKNKKMNISILADSIESLIGGIYLDGGFASAKKFINKTWGPYLNVEDKNMQDPKTKLQEISQQKNKKLPEYKLIKREGPPHSPIFTVHLKVLDVKKIISKGESIRDAEKNAASIALKLINAK
tara:strand:+ start:87 stop:782 length:696 start_codon:yes stop_codon:yes gene_type:complete